jgi:hypothetical protein
VLMTTKPAFHVSGMVEGERLHVLGRCGDCAIRLDDMFDHACLYKPREGLEEFANPPQLQDAGPVSLRVAAIHAYERELPILEAGMTGSLVLVGDGQNRVVPGTILEGSAKVNGQLQTRA